MGRGFDPKERITPAQVDQLTERLYRPLMATRQQMQDAALDMHESLTGYRPQVRPIYYTKQWLHNVVEKELADPWNAEVDQGLTVDREARIEHFKTAVHTTAETAARRSTIHAVHEDTANDNNDWIVGYARVIQGEYTCPFCIMLASRGPVYSQREYQGYVDAAARKAAGTTETNEYMDDFHWRCDCVMVPVLKSKEHTWDGYGDWQRFEKAWQRITKGYSSKDAVNAWRRHFREASRRGVDPLTMPVLPKQDKKRRVFAA